MQGTQLILTQMDNAINNLSHVTDTMEKQNAKHKKPTIKHWCEDDKPAYKLLTRGNTALSDSELISIILRDGNKDMNVVDFSKHLRSKAELRELAKMGLHELMRLGLTETKATLLMACFELSRRHRREESIVAQKKQITNSRDIHEYLIPFIADLPHEEFRALYLNRAHRIMDNVVIGVGSDAGVVADVKKIISHALLLKTCNVIVAHNHPSGNLKPSPADINLTKLIRKGGKLLDITLLDHVIVSPLGHYSFADEGML